LICLVFIWAIYALKMSLGAFLAASIMPELHSILYEPELFIAKDNIAPEQIQGVTSITRSAKASSDFPFVASGL